MDILMTPAECIEMPAAADGEELEALAERFTKMKAELAALGDIIRAVKLDGRWSDGLETVMAERECLLREQLYEVSWQVAETKAGTLAGLRAKAWIMADRCNDEHIDIVTELARSISNDILALPKWARGLSS